MLYFGPAGAPEECRTTKAAIKYIHDEGLNAMEVEFVRGVRMKSEDAKKVGKLAKDYDIRLSTHAPYFINLNSQKKETVEKSRTNILSTMKVSHAMGAEIVVVHAGYYSGKSSEDATNAIMKQISLCRKIADERGFEDVYIGLELMGRQSAWGTMDEVEIVCNNVERTLPVVDFAHIHARCGGCLTTKKKFSEIMTWYEKMKYPFMHTHFSGIEYGSKGEKKHLNIDAKSPDYSLLGPILRGKNYDIILICESPILNKDALRMKKIVEKAR